MLIIMEGLDGSGKTTQIQRLTSRIENLGYEDCLVREPGGTELGEEIRQLVKGYRGGNENTPMANLLLFNAARQQLYATVVEPALASGKIVVQDRGRDSSVAYQGSEGDISAEVIDSVCDIATNGRRADLTLFVDITPEERNRRLAERGEQSDAFEDKGDDYFIRVRNEFHRLASDNEHRWSVIDGEGSLDEVEERVWNVVQSRLEAHVS